MHVVALATSFLLHDPARPNYCCFKQNILTCWVEERSSGCSRCEGNTNCNNSRQVFIANHVSSNGISRLFPPSLRPSHSTKTASMRTPSTTKHGRLRRTNGENMHTHRFNTQYIKYICGKPEERLEKEDATSDQAARRPLGAAILLYSSWRRHYSTSTDT